MTAVLGVEIGRPDKPLFGPPDPVTKLELADYAAAVAPAMLPLVRDRPLNLERFPDGIDGRRLGLRADAFTLRTVPERLAEHGDPWAGIDDAAGTLGATLRELAG